MDALSVSALDWRRVLGILLSLVLVSVVKRLRAWHRLRHVKGPFWAAFSRWWMLRRIVSGRMHMDTREVNDKYGKHSPPRAVS